MAAYMKVYWAAYSGLQMVGAMSLCYWRRRCQRVSEDGSAVYFCKRGAWSIEL